VLRAGNGWDGVILARKVVPTIKRVLKSDGHIEGTVDRSVLYEAETPQMVRREVLLRAYKADSAAVLRATDEAGLLEAIGARVKIVTHTGWNPKLTTVTDLMLAQAMMEKGGAPGVRIGIGFDTHRLVPGRKLWLGGVTVPSTKGSLGHSDGDALLHAVADAILGGIGRGDIGEWFSDKDRRWKNMKSSIIVSTVMREAKKLGWVPYHIDSNIILQTPKLGPHKMRIRKKVAKIVGLPPDSVSVKARTREGLGPEGEGLAVTCQAVVAMKRVSDDQIP
jgi:2-C-methyl-D-erythritol 4-phosphate cytidylyltransferase/2-C-methyl-D-erythritol 2,4-cyclodiphosphate synthase